MRHVRRLERKVRRANRRLVLGVVGALALVATPAVAITLVGEDLTLAGDEAVKVDCTGDQLAHLKDTRTSMILACGSGEVVPPPPPPPPPPVEGEWVRPGLHEAWDSQEENESAGGVIDNGPSRVVWVDNDLDFWWTPNRVAQTKAQGYKVACYMVTGAWESYRNDAAQFPGEVIGQSTGWSGERYLDLRPAAVAKFWPLMEARLDRAAALGCDVVDPDQNNHIDNDTGFPESRADVKAYYLKVADAAHARGMGALMKNGVEVLDADLADAYDGGMSESCTEYDECGPWSLFIQRNKPVWEVEYASSSELESHADDVCPTLNEAGFLGVVKTDPMSGRDRVGCR